MEYDQISSLDKSRTNWRIKVRVTKMWTSVSSSTGVDKGFNLILLDEDNTHIHAYVYPDIWHAIREVIEEGRLYVISHFYTRETTGKLKPTSNKMCITFSNATTVRRVEHDDFMIPAHKFEFVDLGDLYDVANLTPDGDIPEFAADVIGVVEDLENLWMINTKFGDRQIVRFRLTDGRYSTKITIWGQLAKSTAPLFQVTVETPIIAIISSTKLTIFKSSVQVSTLPSSKIYINLDAESVSAMRERLNEEGYQAPQITADVPTTLTPNPDEVETLTLKELAQKNSNNWLKTKFRCSVKITKVEEQDNWWYYSCNVCQEKVQKIDGRFRCSKCVKNMPFAEKRFRILILAEDSTEAFNIIFSDRAAKRLIGKTPTKIMADEIKNHSGSSFSPIISQLSGKDVTLTVVINDDNVVINSMLFYAIDVHEHIQNGDSAITGCSSTSIGETVVKRAEEVTPDSIKTVSKKVKVEDSMLQLKETMLLSFGLQPSTIDE